MKNYTVVYKDTYDNELTCKYENVDFLVEEGILTIVQRDTEVLVAAFARNVWTRIHGATE